MSRSVSATPPPSGIFGHAPRKHRLRHRAEPLLLEAEAREAWGNSGQAAAWKARVAKKP